MRSVATRLRGAWFLSVFFGVAPALIWAQECRCPERPKGPGGGVRCTKDQIATCDPSKGECNCSCDSAPRGKKKEEYLSVIFSRGLGTEVTPSELSEPKYQDLMASFLRSENKGNYSLTKIVEGKQIQVNVSLPEWLVSALKN